MDYFNFLSPIILRVTGKDSQRYLHARLTNDIKGLRHNQSCQAAALSPQGRTLALFTVHKLADDNYILSCDGGDRQKVIQALKQFIVADRVAVEELSHGQLHVFGKIAADPSEEFLAIQKARGQLAGTDVLYPFDKFQNVLNLIETPQEIFSAEFHFRRILAGKPSFPEELNEDILFPESNLLEAVSFSKGCYAGQEVVEMVAARGKPPRILIRLLLKGKLPPNASIVRDPSSGKDIGDILSSSHSISRDETAVYARVINREFTENEVLVIDQAQATVVG